MGDFKCLSSLHNLWVGGAALGGAHEVNGLSLGGGGGLGVNPGAARGNEHGEVDGGGVEVGARARLLDATLKHPVVPVIGGVADGQVVAPLLRHQVHSAGGKGWWLGRARAGGDEGREMKGDDDGAERVLMGL